MDRGRRRAMLTFVFASASAPFASRATTTSKWPFNEAEWSGVHPFCGAGEHRGQCLHLRAHTRSHARTLACTLSRYRSNPNTCTISDIRAIRTLTYTDTHMHARTHIRIHDVAGWGRQGNLAPAAATYCGPCLAVGQSLTDPGAYPLWRSSLAADAPS
jgi:hypothetical protein